MLTESQVVLQVFPAFGDGREQPSLVKVCTAMVNKSLVGEHMGY